MGSRRACEALITAGRVTVNGTPILHQGLCINPDTDTVEVDGQGVFAERKLTFMFNKPVGVLCTCRDTHDRQTFLDFFPGFKERLYPVGRLDQDSEGLLIVTNDGDLALHLTHPRHEVAKTYYVQLNRVLSPEARRKMLEGIDSDGERLRAESVTADPGTPGDYRIVLKEGKKRQIRRMAQAVGAGVLTLRRVAIGSLLLGALPEGKARALSESEMKSLFRDAGLKPASERETQ